jgi:hypothetical protein
MESFLQLEECLNGNKENLKAQITEDIIINQGRQNIKQQVKPPVTVDNLSIIK